MRRQRFSRSRAALETAAGRSLPSRAEDEAPTAVTAPAATATGAALHSVVTPPSLSAMPTCLTEPLWRSTHATCT
eukprot:812101-Pyramimonas_sp.AAC.1